MTSVYIKGRRHRLTPTKVIGKGGEADVYDIGNDTVLKLFKRPDDPDYLGNPNAQSAAAQRIVEQQQKLPAFPRRLPAAVISPVDLAYNDQGSREIVGYTMPFLKAHEVLLRYSDRQYREQGGIDDNQVVEIFRNLHETVKAVHQAGVVIGDFNDLNVLVDITGQVFLVDADSMQFGAFDCRAFTTRFVDPLHCNSQMLTLNQRHSPESDWYAFNIMLMQSLLYVGPYGGVHRPQSGKKLQHDARVLKRLTIFDSEVIYPKPALHYSLLPDELLDYFTKVYKHDQRGIFPVDLLRALRWTNCSTCGTVHARPRCPQCAAPGIVKEVSVVRGKVIVTSVFRTTGRILHATTQRGKLLYLYHEGTEFKREGGAVALTGALDPELRFRVQGTTTLIGKRDRLFVLAPGQAPQQLTADQVDKLTVFDTNQEHRFWVQNGQLVRDSRLGTEYIGDVLSGRTLLWAGNRFGFGFYQAGRLMRSFVFRTDGQGINDQVAIPPLSGQLIDATCVFSDQLAWFMVSLQDSGRLINRCFVIDASGKVRAETQASPDEDLWLASGIRGHCASGTSLFTATDEGILRVSLEGSEVNVTQTFPDTEPFVDSHTHLLPGSEGIYAVNAREIRLLKLR